MISKAGDRRFNPARTSELVVNYARRVITFEIHHELYSVIKTSLGNLDKHVKEFNRVVKVSYMHWIELRPKPSYFNRYPCPAVGCEDDDVKNDYDGGMTSTLN